MTGAEQSATVRIDFKLGDISQAMEQFRAAMSRTMPVPVAMAAIAPPQSPPKPASPPQSPVAMPTQPAPTPMTQSVPGSNALATRAIQSVPKVDFTKPAAPATPTQSLPQASATVDVETAAAVPVATGFRGFAQRIVSKTKDVFSQTWEGLKEIVKLKELQEDYGRKTGALLGVLEGARLVASKLEKIPLLGWSAKEVSKGIEAGSDAIKWVGNKEKRGSVVETVGGAIAGGVDLAKLFGVEMKDSTLFSSLGVKDTTEFRAKLEKYKLVRPSASTQSDEDDEEDEEGGGEKDKKTPADGSVAKKDQKGEQAKQITATTPGAASASQAFGGGWYGSDVTPTGGEATSIAATSVAAGGLGNVFAALAAQVAAATAGLENFSRGLATSSPEPRAKLVNHEKERDIAKAGVSHADADRKPLESLTGPLNKLALASLAAAYGMNRFIGDASPDAAATLSGSFKLLSGEIGMMFLPAVVRVSGYLQDAAKWVRELSPGTKSFVSNVAVMTTGLAALGWGITRLVSVINAVSAGLAWAGVFRGGAGVAGAVAGPAAALAGSGASVAGQVGTAGATGVGSLAGRAMTWLARSTPWIWAAERAYSGVQAANETVNTGSSRPILNEVQRTADVINPGQLLGRSIAGAYSWLRGENQPGSSVSRVHDQSPNRNQVQTASTFQAQMISDPSQIYQRIATQANSGGGLDKSLEQLQKEGNALLQELVNRTPKPNVSRETALPPV